MMVGLTALLISLSFILSASLGERRVDAANTISIQIPAENVSDALIASVKDELKRTPAVANVKEVSPEALRSHLAPWMGELKNQENWPLPYMLRVKLSPVSDSTIANVRTRMEKLGNDIHVDGTAIWASQYASIVRVVQLVLLALALLLMATLAVIIIFASRTAMKLHLPAVYLLHGIGASDRYIARQFQHNALTLVLKGALTGTCAALVILLGIGFALYHTNASLLPRIRLSAVPLAFLILLPFLASTIGVLAARATTLKQLRHLP